MLANLIILLFLLMLSAFFSAVEVAFVSLTNAKVEAMVKRKLPRATLVKKLKKNQRRLIITILIGNNVVNISAASLATVIAAGLFDSAVIGITTGVMTILILIFGEIIPKSYAANHAKHLAILAAPLLKILQWVGFPIIIIFEWLARAFTGKQRQERVTEEEIKAISKQGAKQGAIEKQEHIMIRRLFKLNDITARDIMTPRKNIACIESDMSIDEATEIIEHKAHTRFPVYHNTLDNIIGMVHSRDVLLVYHRESEEKSIQKILRPIITIKPNTPIDDVMHEFQKKKTHMGIVKDKSHKILGIITLEDIIEELVGEIIDEHDED